MTQTDTSRPPRDAVLAQLCEQFAVFRNAQPLALGIHKAIEQQCPELDAKQLRVALRIHTASTRYLKALVAGQARFALDGQPAGEISEAQRTLADTALRERLQKMAERRQAEARAKREVKGNVPKPGAKKVMKNKTPKKMGGDKQPAQKPEVEQGPSTARRDKLAQLAAHFNRR